MFTYIVRRLGQTVISMFIASFVVFLAIQLVPGDPVIAMFYPRVPSQERVQAVREELNLDDPIPVRYIYWLNGLLHGDLGDSFKQNRPVGNIIMENIWPTIQLAIAGILISLISGLPSGVLAALKQDTLIDHGVMAFALIGISAPSFWLGLILIFIFCSLLGWLPTSGTGGIDKLILPGLTLGLYGGGYLARFARSSVLEEKNKDYVDTARSKGLREFSVNFRHILRNSLIPIVTIAGVLAGYMVGGAVIVEIVFGRQGIGHLLINAIKNKDYMLVEGLFLVSVITFCLLNLLVDVLYAYIDPRIRYD